MAMSARRVEPAPSFAAQFGDNRRQLPGAAFRPLADLRSASFDRFEALGIPSPRQEAWKYTNVTRLAKLDMALAPSAQAGVGEVLAVAAGGPGARRLIFVDGHFVPALSHFENLPAGVRVASLAAMLESDPERVIATLAGSDDGAAFTALNAAFAGSGAWIELDDGAVLREPLQLIFLAHGQERPVMSHPRLVVRLGRGARLRLIETYATTGERQTLTNVVSQIDLAPDAVLEHDRSQIVGPGATLLGKAFISLADRSRLEQSTATLGGRLVRNEHMVSLNGSKVECRLNGLFMPHGQEHVDSQVRIDHLAPDSHSDQFYKGVISGRAHAVFAGKIFVHQPAQKTNAYQKNDNLLLSDDAEIDTKPELEIYADDVKCSHGATCGDLDPQALFYLRSRGLPAATAASLLTYSFVGEVIERFADATVKAAIRKAVLGRLPGGAALEVEP